MIITIDLTQPLSDKDREILFAVLDDSTPVATAAATQPDPPESPPPTPPPTPTPAPSSPDVKELTEKASQTALKLIDQGKTDLVRAALIASGVARVSDLDTLAKHDLFSKFLEEQGTAT